MKKIPHAILRAKERYDLDLQESDLIAISDMLRAGGGVLVAKSDDGGAVWMVRYAGKVCRIAASLAFRIQTFLPPKGPPIAQGSGRITNGKDVAWLRTRKRRKHSKLKSRKYLEGAA